MFNCKILFLFEIQEFFEAGEAKSIHFEQRHSYPANLEIQCVILHENLKILSYFGYISIQLGSKKIRSAFLMRKASIVQIGFQVVIKS